MPKARCKFRVQEVTRMGSGGNMERIKLSAEYDPNDPDDTKFAEATPQGTLDFHLSNPALVGTFNPGEVYYLDLIPVDAE